MIKQKSCNTIRSHVLSSAIILHNIISNICALESLFYYFHHSRTKRRRRIRDGNLGSTPPLHRHQLGVCVCSVDELLLFYFYSSLSRLFLWIYFTPELFPINAPISVCYSLFLQRKMIKNQFQRDTRGPKVKCHATVINMSMLPHCGFSLGYIFVLFHFPSLGKWLTEDWQTDRQTGENVILRHTDISDF